MEDGVFHLRRQSGLVRDLNRTGIGDGQPSVNMSGSVCSLTVADANGVTWPTDADRSFVLRLHGRRRVDARRA
jgi:hypothetical protein